MNSEDGILEPVPAERELLVASAIVVSEGLTVEDDVTDDELPVLDTVDADAFTVDVSPKKNICNVRQTSLVPKNKSVHTFGRC